MKYRYLNEVLLDWNGSENIQDNSIIKSSDIKGLKKIDSYNVNGVKFKMIRMKHIKPTFYLGETLVTKELWEAVMGYTLPANEDKDPKVPANNIAPYSLGKKFLDALNVITGYNFRIPTEKEWEDCVGDFIKKHFNSNRRFDDPENKLLHKIAWNRQNSGETLQPVASKEPNEYGLYDMLGNSWEWCLKSHQSSGMSAFVAKGGSYKISPDEMSATNAWGNICSFGGDANGIGIRLALDLN